MKALVMTALENLTASRDSVVGALGPDLDGARLAGKLSRRQLLSRLGIFSATRAAARAMAAKPSLPCCEKGAEQLLALGEYQKVLQALPSEADCPRLKDLHER